MSNLFNWRERFQHKQQLKSKVQENNNEFLSKFNSAFCEYCEELEIFKPRLYDVRTFLTLCGFKSSSSFNYVGFEKDGITFLIKNLTDEVIVSGKDLNFHTKSIKTFLTQDFIDRHNLLFREDKNG